MFVLVDGRAAVIACGTMPVGGEEVTRTMAPQSKRTAATAAPRKKRTYTSALEQFGQAMAELRTKRGMTLRELESVLRDQYGIEISDSTLNRMEHGETALPPTKTIEAIDAALDASGILIVLSIPARAEPFRHLPIRPHAFVGRDAALARLTDLLCPPPDATTTQAAVAAIVGQAGVGKTALGLSWANDAEDTFAKILFTELRGFSSHDPATPGEILADLLAGLDVTVDQLPPKDDQRLALLRGHLATLAAKGQRVLMILDNAADSRQVKPVLTGAPNASVLITSRQRLAGLTVATGAHQVHLDPLDEAAAIEMAGRYIGPERANQEQDAVRRLASLCDYLPLALRIAGERIGKAPDRPIWAHVDELQEACLELLDAADDEDTTGVRAAFSWSYNALPASQAELFRALGLNPGPQISETAAAALVGRSTDDTRDDLQGLVQAHLLQQVGRCLYRLHDLLRDYAAEKASAPDWAAERPAATTRLVQWYLHGANAAVDQLMPGRDHHIDLGPPPDGISPPAFSDSTQALAWCDQEITSLTPIAKLALQQGLLFEAWWLPIEFIDYHVVRRPWQTWISSLDVAYEAATKAGRPDWAGHAASNLAEAHRRLDELDRADELDILAIELLTPLGPNARLAWSLVGRGNTAHARGQYVQALDFLQRGADMQAEVGHLVGELTARANLGRAHRELGDRDQALTEGIAAVEGFRASGDRHGEAYALTALARTHRAFGDVDDALSCCERAADLFRRVGDLWGTHEAIALQGEMLHDLGDLPRALSLLTTAVVGLSSIDPAKAARLQAKIKDIAST